MNSIWRRWNVRLPLEGSRCTGQYVLYTERSFKEGERGVSLKSWKEPHEIFINTGILIWKPARGSLMGLGAGGKHKDVKKGKENNKILWKRKENCWPYFIINCKLRQTVWIRWGRESNHGRLCLPLTSDQSARGAKEMNKRGIKRTNLIFVNKSFFN